MKAARLHSYGEALRIDEVPEPRAEAPHDVVVRLAGAGVCRSDLGLIAGEFAAMTGIELPYVLGHENAGWVEAVGSDVSGVAVGDAVIAHPAITCGRCRACRAGRDMQCTDQSRPGITHDGGYAELMRTSERALVRLPEGVEPQEVAAQGDAGLTAYHAVKKASRTLTPGSQVLVIGAGGVGHVGVQLLDALTACRAIVSDPSELARQLATEAGVEMVVGAEPADLEQVREATDGLGCEAVIDFVGEQPTIEAGMSLLADGGTYYSVGHGGTLSISTAELMLREVSVVGNLIGTYAELAELMDLTAAGKVGSHVEYYPLDAANEAIEDLRSGRVQGRAILQP